jgi:hypothetical protein
MERSLILPPSFSPQPATSADRPGSGTQTALRLGIDPSGIFLPRRVRFLRLALSAEVVGCGENEGGSIRLLCSFGLGVVQPQKSKINV